MNDQDPRQGPDWVEDVKTEVTGMAKEGVLRYDTANSAAALAKKVKRQSSSSPP